MSLIRSKALRQMIREALTILEGDDFVGGPIYKLPEFPSDEVGPGIPVSYLHPTDMSNDWQAGYPDKIKHSCVALDSWQVATIPKHVYLPLLESFYKYMGMGDVEGGVAESAKWPLQQFGQNIDKFLVIPKAVGDRAQTTGYLRLQRSELANDLLQKFKAYMAYATREMWKIGIDNVTEWVFVSRRLSQQQPPDCVNTKLDDLDKAFLLCEAIENPVKK